MCSSNDRNSNPLFFSLESIKIRPLYFFVMGVPLVSVELTIFGQVLLATAEKSSNHTLIDVEFNTIKS